MRPSFFRLAPALAALAFAAAHCAAPQAARAESWRPEKLTIVLGQTAEGFDGRLVRGLARAWGRTLFAPVAVRALGRDASLEAASEFARAPRDGTVVLAGDLGRLALDYARERPAWIWARTLEHLRVFALDPAVLFTAAGAGVDDLDDVVLAAHGREYAVGVGRWVSLENLAMQDAAHLAGLRLAMRPVGSGESLLAAVSAGAVRLAVGRLSEIAPYRRKVQVLAELGGADGALAGYRPLQEALGVAAMPAGRVAAVTVHAGFQRDFPARHQRLERTLARAVASEEFRAVMEDMDLRIGAPELRHDDLMGLVRRWWDAEARVAGRMAAVPPPVRTRGRIERVEDGGRRLRYLGLDGKRHDMRADADGTALAIDGRPVGGARPLAEIRPGMLCVIAWPSAASREASELDCRLPR